MKSGGEDVLSHSADIIEEQNQDYVIQSLQSSTRALINQFRDRTKFLSKFSKDIKILLREGYDIDVAKRTAASFFGKKKVSFIAIDGTESQDQQLDILLFYVGAFAYVGQIEFAEKGCECGEIVQASTIRDISTAVPLYEGDASSIAGNQTEAGIEVDSQRLPSILMQFSEYYLAVKLLQDNSDLKVVILDRTLAGDVGHLVWSISEFIKERKCLLQGLNTDFGIVSPLDLELARMLHPNPELGIPAARSQFIKYAAINLLLSSIKERKTSDVLDYKVLLNKVGAQNARLSKLVNDLTRFNQQYSFLRTKDDQNSLAIDPRVQGYWERVFSATMRVARHIFETPADEHPLIYNEIWNDIDTTNGDRVATRAKKWITTSDLEYMTLVMIYALLRYAWEKNVLVIGLIKDTGASELLKTVVPILRSAHKTNIDHDLPKFNSDKQLLQTYSVIEPESIKAPWRTFEFDACFRTMTPFSNDAENDYPGNNYTGVKGAYKNVISGERMFVKSYIQLWQSEKDHGIRSHVFSYDRPCYANLDKANELVLMHKDDKVVEEIRPMIHFKNDSPISHLVMDILCSMAREVIPECLGHNYPLFLADKKAKYVLGQMKEAYLSTVAYEMANSEFDQQVLYEARFRDFRSQIENSRRSR